MEERKKYWTNKRDGGRKKEKKGKKEKPETQKVNEQILSLIKYTDPTFRSPFFPNDAFQKVGEKGREGKNRKEEREREKR